MWFKSLIIFLGLFVTFEIVKSDKIVFRSNSTVKINDTQFNELNCTFKMPLKRFCLNITEVTCLEEAGNVKLCQVTDKNSIFLNKYVLNETLVCNSDKKRSLKGNCYLLFKPKVAQNLTDAFHFEVVGYDSNGMPKTKLVSDIDDPFNKDRFNNDPFNHPFFKKNEKLKSTFDDPDWFEKSKQRHNEMSTIFFIGFAIIFGLMILFIILGVCRSLCDEADGCTPCQMFKSTPIISEQSRRTSFPRTDNYGITQNINQSTPYVPQMNTYPVSNPNFNHNEAAMFNDPPPNYSNFNYTTGCMPPSYSSLGQINKAYVPGSLPFSNSQSNQQDNTQTTQPSAPEKF